MIHDIDVLELSKQLAIVWQRAANHEKLSIADITVLRETMIVFDRIEQCGEELQNFLGTGENDVSA